MALDLVADIAGYSLVLNNVALNDNKINGFLIGPLDIWRLPFRATKSPFHTVMPGRREFGIYKRVFEGTVTYDGCDHKIDIGVVEHYGTSWTCDITSGLIGNHHCCSFTQIEIETKGVHLE